MRVATLSTTQDLAQSARLLSINPLIGTIKEFASPPDIDALDSFLMSKDFATATVAGPDGPVVSDARSARYCKIPHHSFEPLDRLTQKIGSLFQLKPELCEYPELICYEVGGEFKRHFDAALGGAMPGRAQSGIPSQRVFTAILYLNDSYSGGTTRFPRLNIEVQPKRGTLAFWQNTKPGSASAHHLSMHQGCPVTKGTKRIISFWFRDNPWTPTQTSQTVSQV